MTARVPDCQDAFNPRSKPSGLRHRRYSLALWIHRWSGLLAAPFFFVLCVTGSILIFHEEIDTALGDLPPRSSGAARKGARPLRELTMAALRPGERVVSVYLDRDHEDRLAVAVAPLGFSSLETAEIRYVERDSGLLFAPRPSRVSLTSLASRLHTEWFAGLYGQLFGGIVALLVLICLVSGLFLYAPHVRGLVFGEVRRARGTRVLQRDLHNVVGAIVLGWLCVVSVTGAMLATTDLLYEAYSRGELRNLSGDANHAGVADPIDIDRVMASSAAALPGTAPRYVVYPDTDFTGPGTFTVFLYGTRSYDERLFHVAVIDAATGRVDAIRRAPLALAAIAVAQPLHFGTYGGLALRLTWLAATWAALFVTFNGAWLWWHRRSLYRRMLSA